MEEIIRKMKIKQDQFLKRLVIDNNRLIDKTEIAKEKTMNYFLI